MKAESYYYNCSPSYIDSIAPDLQAQITETIEVMPKRSTQSEIDFDLFWLLTSIGWSFAKAPSGISAVPDECLGLDCQLRDIKPLNLRRLCRTTETLDNHWYADFGKQFDAGIVQIETQFGKMEALFKELCGFRMAYAERRLALGIEIVMVNPGGYFARRKSAASGLARFKMAKDTLNTIGLDCPIWLVGIAE
jgi:hypothetical protein